MFLLNFAFITLSFGKSLVNIYLCLDSKYGNVKTR